MALVLADRVRETTTSTGTGAVTLAGAFPGYQSFSVIGNGNTTYYCIAGQGTSEWEVGIGTYTSAGTSLSRDTVLSSSNGGSLVSFSVGTKDVWVDYAAGKAVTTDTLAYPPAIGNTTPAAGTFTTLTANSTLQAGKGSANYIQGVGAATTLEPVISVIGSDTNVPLAIKTQGTGAIDLAPGSGGVNLSNGGTVTAITRTASGTLYTAIPALSISAPTTAGGVQATASVAFVQSQAATIANGGTGYTVNDVLTISGGTPTSVAATFTVTTVSAGVITGVTATNFATYSVLPSNPVSVTGGTGTGATLNATWGLSGNAGSFTITNAGSGYVEQPTVSFSGGGGSGAAAYATVGGTPIVRTLGQGLSFYTPSGEAFRVVDIGNTTANFIRVSGGTSGNGPGIYSVGADTNVDFVSLTKGTGNFRFLTNQAQEQLRVSHTASAVNYVQVTGSATGSSPIISAQGSDTNISFTINAKGTGSVFLQVAGQNVFQTSGVGTVANRLLATGTATGIAPIMSTVGTDTNIALALQSKGTGAIDLAPGSSGVNISNGGTVTAITRTVQGSLYTSVPSLVISAPTTAGGVQATATANLGVLAATIVSGGTGYTAGDTLTVVGGTGTAAQLTVGTVSAGVITSVSVAAQNGVYSVFPTSPVSVTGGTGSSATFNISGGILSVFTITNAGSGYVEQPTVSFSGGGGSGAAAYATVGSGTIIRSLGATGTQSIDFQGASSISTGVPNFRIRDAGANSFVMVGSATDTAVIVAQGATNAVLSLASNGTQSVRINTNGTSGTEQLRITHTASAVNYVQVTGAATGARPAISAQGSDSAINMQYDSKSTGYHVFRTNGVFQFVVLNTTGAVNYTRTTGSLTGAAPSFSVEGSDTNIDLALQAKGTGYVKVNAGTGLGYGTGTGGAVTQATSRTTGVTLNFPTGAITLFSAAGTTAWQTFTVTNSAVAATDTIIVNQKSGADLYQIFVTNVAAGSFKISFATTGGTTVEQPVFNFAVLKGVAA